ncbi:GTPase [Methanothermococcus okinawensis]|uniref:GTP-binding protein HSR1-related protein n=1 Tax=Methanothermococcus okinawensis (strain DSM 14208 / JCM 11175 / IH1) TaxID=647113 RepID=F8AMC7_METOI|nr:GTPase [Methanothermococcus okinawensis]AEH06817.1 GTP-binding protein HSR1-related protein [Methanothermococcus okinawensis IH1]
MSGKKIKRVPAKKIAQKIINECHIILAVLDARNPEGTRNKNLEDKIKKENKKLIYVLNKADLVPVKILEKWKDIIKSENPEASVVFVSSKYKNGTKILRDNIKKYLQLMGIKEGKVGVVGYPNVGKSSLINALTGKKSAASGLVAGLTKGEQWIRLTKNIKLLDTPGVIEPKDEDELVMIGALRYEKIENPIEPAIKILRNLYAFDENIIKKYYGIEINDINDISDINEEFIEKIGKKLNYLGKNGIIDMKRTAKSIIKDYQDGKLNYYPMKIKKYSQKRGKDIEFIAKYLKDFPFIDDANAIISHLSDISELCNIKLKYPIIGSKNIDDVIVVISFGEKTADGGRKKVEEYAKNNNIFLYSTGKGRCGGNRLFIGVGNKINE